jgi:hypothetical protein
MKLYVHKYPTPFLIADVQQVADDAPTPAAPWEIMSVEDFDAWQAAQPPLQSPAPVPQSVTRRQLLLALNAQGITRAAIRIQLNAIADATQREASLIEFDEAGDFDRDHPLVAQLGAAFGLDAAAIDNLYRDASGR